jgi:prevent-host-death family protein
MLEIGVRELKASLSSMLRKVEDGEQIKVTVRGRHVADIVPAGARRGNERLRELVAEGKVTPAVRPLPDHPPPAAPGRRSATAIVLADRDEEER